MLKRGDIAVYTLIKDEVEGRKVTAGTRTFDLASGGVEVQGLRRHRRRRSRPT